MLTLLVAVAAATVAALVTWWWASRANSSAATPPSRLNLSPPNVSTAGPAASDRDDPEPSAAAAGTTPIESAEPSVHPSDPEHEQSPTKDPVDPEHANDDDPGADGTPGTGISSTVGGHPGAPAWSAVVDKLQLGVVVMTSTGEIRYRNAQANALAGTHTGLLIDNAVKEALLRALRGDPSTQTVELYGPPQVAVVVSAEPLPDGAAVATIDDVSDRRRVDAVRTDFVANISHELKTPVGAIAVLAEALVDETDLTVVQRIAGRMAEEAHRVAHTVDDLMELSRIELGEEPVRDSVSVHDVVIGATERAAALAESRGIDVAVLDVPDDVRVLGDVRQLVSALGNLVENAVKYSDDGADVQIRVIVESHYAELMVADQGIGIPAADHDRIFERFYRVDKARSRDTGGNGLGLSIVRHVATNHDGEVLVSSQEGEGSTFVLRIPLAPADRDAASGRQRSSQSPGSPRSPTNGATT